MTTLQCSVTSRFLLVVLGWRTATVFADPRYRAPFSKRASPETLVADVWKNRRHLQEQQSTNSTDTCSLCGNYTLFSDVIPPHSPSTGVPETTTCLDLSLFTSAVPRDSIECWGLRESFLYECCQVPPQYECETQLRSSLLTNYDPVVAPTLQNSRFTNVEIMLEFYHITDVNIREGTTEIFVWLNLAWYDPRLAWAGTENDCTTFTTFHASLNKELTEIWVPDLDLYNQADGVQSLPEAQAEVYPDGRVEWRRNGGLKALCFFSGLRQIPFDTLGCRYSLGGWTRFGKVRFTLGGEDGTGFFAGPYVAKYNEYRLIPQLTKTGYFSSSKSIVFYDFYFERSQRYYIVSIAVPAILFTFLSFGMFLLDLRVGERLSYGMALLLVMVAQQIVTTDYLPITETRLWIVVLINASFYWVVFGLVESVYVAYLFFVGDEEIQRDLQCEDDQEEENDSSSDSVDNSSLPTLQQGRSQRKSFLTLKQSFMAHKRPANHNRKLIRKIDKWCFRLVPATYILFLIVFFACLPLWEESGEELWGEGGEFENLTSIEL